MVDYRPMVDNIDPLAALSIVISEVIFSTLRVLPWNRRANLLPLQHLQNLFNIYQVMTGIDETNYQIYLKSLK